MTKIRYVLHQNKGFTLVEVLIALLLFSILSLSVWSFMNHAVRSSDRTQTDIEVIENARIALDFMMEEIRRSKGIRITSSSGPLELDIDGDGEINIGSGDVEFEFDGNQIKYNTQILADYIESVIFEPSPLYLDEDEMFHTEIDSNQDGIMDGNLKITIEASKPAHSLGADRQYKITGEVSIRYKEVITMN